MARAALRRTDRYGCRVDARAHRHRVLAARRERAARLLPEDRAHRTGDDVQGLAEALPFREGREQPLSVGVPGAHEDVGGGAFLDDPAEHLSPSYLEAHPANRVQLAPWGREADLEALDREVRALRHPCPFRVCGLVATWIPSPIRLKAMMVTLETFEPGNRVVLDRYADYWGGWEEGQFTKVVYVITEDPTVRDQMIRSGDADMTSTLPFDSLESLQGQEGLEAYPVLFLAHLVAGFDLSNPPLDDPKVRQALAHTFPYEDVHQGLYLGHGEISMGFGPSSLWEAPADFPRYHLDLERAGALLAEAGHGDGFELDLALSAGVKETAEAMSLWQAQLAKVNVELNIRQLSTGAFWDYAFNPDNEEHDVFVVTAAGDVPSPYSWLVVYTSSPLGWMPYVGHKNDEFDRLVFDAWALEATDADAANDLWVEAQRILHDDAASIFVMDAPTIIAHGDDIVGFEPNPPYANIVFWYQIRRQ